MKKCLLQGAFCLEDSFLSYTLTAFGEKNKEGKKNADKLQVLTKSTMLGKRQKAGAPGRRTLHHIAMVLCGGAHIRCSFFCFVFSKRANSSATEL